MNDLGGVCVFVLESFEHVVNDDRGDLTGSSLESNTVKALDLYVNKGPNFLFKSISLISLSTALKTVIRSSTPDGNINGFIHIVSP
jgi:hypothetical protein